MAHLVCFMMTILENSDVYKCNDIIAKNVYFDLEYTYLFYYYSYQIFLYQEVQYTYGSKYSSLMPVSIV